MNKFSFSLINLKKESALRPSATNKTRRFDGLLIEDFFSIGFMPLTRGLLK